MEIIKNVLLEFSKAVIVRLLFRKALISVLFLKLFLVKHKNKLKKTPNLLVQINVLPYILIS